MKRFGLALVATVAFAVAGPWTAIAAASPPVPAATCNDESVCTAIFELQDLGASVIELVPQHGLANSFLAKVDAATRSVIDGRYGPAADQLDALQHEMDAASDRMETVASNILKAKRDAASGLVQNLK